VLRRIEKRVFSGERITSEEALFLFQNDDIFTLGRLASYVSHKKNGNHVYFIQNYHINPTNICVNRCRFCAFSRSKGDKDAYELSIEEIIKRLKRVIHGSHRSLVEIHIVGGLHPELTFDYYLNLLREIKKRFNVYIKAFTAVEIDYLSKKSGRDIDEVLRMLKEAGLDMMPGGGAEIFNKRIRRRLCPEKINERRWLEIMERAHRIGIRSNATMLYGHIETYKDRVNHMLKLRELQDRTGGFQAFIPLLFHPFNTADIGKTIHSSGIDDIKTIAVSRIFLDNFQHIKAYWIVLGEKIAQLAINFGADDIDGTIIEERIAHSAGAISGYSMTKQELISIIKKAKKIPVERDSFYNPLHRYEDAV